MIKKFLYAITFILASSFGVSAQKTAVANIITSAECGKCKSTIESKMNYTKGVVYAELNVDTKVLEVKYNPKKTNVDTLREELSHIGYDADEVAANPEKQIQLPACCQPGGMKIKK